MGPKMGPFLVACALGLVSFSSVGLAAGYPGASMNPGRCFAFAVARGEFRRESKLYSVNNVFCAEGINFRSMDMVGRALDGWTSTHGCLSCCAPLASSVDARTCCFSSSTLTVELQAGCQPTSTTQFDAQSRQYLNANEHSDSCDRVRSFRFEISKQ